jgi:hypothetical protein
LAEHLADGVYRATKYIDLKAIADEAVDLCRSRFVSLVIEPNPLHTHALSLSLSLSLSLLPCCFVLRSSSRQACASYRPSGHTVDHVVVVRNERGCALRAADAWFHDLEEAGALYMCSCPNAMLPSRACSKIRNVVSHGLATQLQPRRRVPWSGSMLSTLSSCSTPGAGGSGGPSEDLRTGTERSSLSGHEIEAVCCFSDTIIRSGSTGKPKGVLHTTG